MTPPWPWLRLPRALLVSCGVSCGLVAAVLAPSTANGNDPWALERKSDDPQLVEQRFARLKAHPFDDKQWRALRRSLGTTRLARLVEQARQRSPQDPNLRVLHARILLEQGQPGDAADELAMLSDPNSRERALDLHVGALTAAGREAEAIALLEQHAQSHPAAAEQLLMRAFEIAATADLPEPAQRLASALAKLSPQSPQAWLRLGRAATRAGSAAAADRAFAQAIATSRGGERLDAIAQRATARIESGDAAGAAELAWQLVELPRTGSPPERERWWELLVEAHKQAGTAAVLSGKLERWLETVDRTELAAWKAFASAQRLAGSDPSEALRRAIALAPRDLELREAAIEALLAKGNTDAAIAEYEAAPGRSSELVPLGLQIATHLTEAGKHERALELAGAVERRAGTDTGSLLLLLDFYNLNDEPQAALAVAQRIVRLSPRNADARVALGEQLYQMGQVQEALEQWGRLPQLIRPAHRGHASLAQVLSEHGRLTEAVAALKRALTAAPDLPEYVRLRAVLAEQQRRPTNALELWERVRELCRPRDEHRLLCDEARTRVVELLVGGAIPKRHGKLEEYEAEALSLLQQGEPHEDAVEAGRFLAELYTRRELYGAAVTVQQRLLQLRPNDPSRYEELATAQRRAGLVDSALGTLEELLGAAPKKSADVLAEMSELSFEAGDARGALARATKAAEQDHRHIDAIVRLGELHEREGDLDEAEKAYARALETSPQHTVALLKLAELAVVRGEPEKSSALLRQVLIHGGAPELVREAGRRALDLAQASAATMQWVEFAVERTQQRPEADEPREFLLEALDRSDAKRVDRWLRSRSGQRDPAREQALRVPLVSALARGSVADRLRAAEHLGRLELPETAVPLVQLARSLNPPRNATDTIRDAFERTRISAVRAAGTLADPASTTEISALLADTSQSAEARHQAAWALAHIDTPQAATILGESLRLDSDPTMAALACVALSRRQPNETAAELLANASVLAQEHPTAHVRHICAYAEAALAPDGAADRYISDLLRSDPLIAAVAAWRLGRVDEPTQAVWTALFRRYLGPPGLARDAAGAALATLLADRTPDTAADPVPPPPRGRHWTAGAERWLRARLAPRYEAVSPAVVAPHQHSLAEALERALEGTRAERLLARQLQAVCPGQPQTSASPEHRPLCLAPLVEQTFWLTSPAPSARR